jgi:hypothetical protein
MNIAVLSIIGLVLLLGLIAFGAGTRGWGWGTVVFAFLSLFSAVGFVYYVARVGERERAWRNSVRSLQVEIARTRDAQTLGADGRFTPLVGEQPLDELTADLERWKRASERSKVWRGRFWEGASFQPPRAAGNEQAATQGTLRIKLTEESPNVPLAAGGQVHLFDDAAVEAGGRYLGAFLIESTDKDGGEFRLKLAPAFPPTPAEQKLWSKSYESVTAFEQLPYDSWITFFRTEQPAAEGEEASAETEDGEMTGDVIPPTRKTNPAKLLDRLESRLEEFDKHEAVVPDEEWRALIDEKRIKPALYWATVEFTEPHALPARGGGKDGEEGREPYQFEVGDTAEFDLETAAELAAAKVAEIKKVVYRRFLVDAASALRGEAIQAGQESSVTAQGLTALRESLVRHIAEIRATRDSLKAGLKKTDETLEVLRKEQADLSADLDRWRQDGDAATEVATDFENRLAAVRRQLGDAWETVVQWGREYDGSMSLLQADLDKRAPPPE